MDEGIYDILLDEGWSPEDIERLFELGVLAGESESIVPRQRAMAEELRGVRTPRGRSYGGVYEAANPLEFLGAGLQYAAGQFGDYKANKRQEEILKSQAELRACFLRGNCGSGKAQTSGLPATPQVPAQPAVSYGVDLPQGTPYSQWQPYIGPQPIRR